MPHSTQAYPFEQKVWQFADSCSQRFGGSGRHSFVMEFDNHGACLRLHLECPKSSWREFLANLEEHRAPYLWYDLSDAPEYIGLSWTRIDQKVMERLIESEFDDADFVSHPAISRRAPNLPTTGRFPETWNVLF